MTKTFTYTFTQLQHSNGTGTDSVYTETTITLKKRVTDSMEPTNCRKAGYAANYFNNVLRRDYGFTKSVVTAAKICEIK